MSYLLNYKGVKIIAKSADEAVELARKLVDEPKPVKDDPATAEKKFASFWGALDLKHKKMLQSLSENPDGLVTDVLATTAGIDATNLKYAMKTIHSQARKAGVTDILTVLRRKIFVNKLPKSKYSLKEKARKAIQSCTTPAGQ